MIWFEKQPSGPAGSVSATQPLSTYLHLASPSSWYNLGRQSGLGLLERFHTHPHLLRSLGTQLSTTVGRERPMAWGFIPLPVRAIGPSPWEVDGSLNIKSSPFHSPSYTTVVVYIISCSHNITRMASGVSTESQPTRSDESGSLLHLFFACSSPSIQILIAV